MERKLKRPELGLGEKLIALHWPLALSLAAIAAIGYAVLYSAGGGSAEPWAWRHGVKFLGGFVLMLCLALIDVRFWFHNAYRIYALAFALLIGVEIVGSLSKGAQRWIDLGFFRLQPSEIMKLALALALARFFHAAYVEDLKNPLRLIAPTLLAIAPAALVLRQPDLGTTLMLLALAGAMFFMAGVRVWKFAALIAIGAIAAPIAYGQLHDYQKQRVQTFLDPESDPLGSGYHIIQSKIALGSGGLWGKGYLEGTQSQLEFLPEKQTDFVFTMFAEEMGLAGGLVLLALYLIVALIGVVIAIRCQSQFARLLAIGLSFNFFLYVVINVAMVTGAIPVVGVPLPLVSYGGTAMVTALIGFGMILSADIHADVTIPRYPEPKGWFGY